MKPRTNTLLLALGALLLLASVVGAQAGASPGTLALFPSTALTSALLPSTPLGTSGTSGTGTSTALSASYDLAWWTVDGGGAVGAGSPRPNTRGGTSGQPDAGPVLANGGYTLAGGFWGGAAAQYNIYLPVVLRS